MRANSSALNQDAFRDRYGKLRFAVSLRQGPLDKSSETQLKHTDYDRTPVCRAVLKSTPKFFGL